MIYMKKDPIKMVLNKEKIYEYSGVCNDEHTPLFVF